MDHITFRRQINSELLIRIDQIHSLPRFTGDRTRGIRKGSQRPTNFGQPAEERPIDIDEGGNFDEEDLDEEDETVGDIGGIVDYINNLT